MGKLQRLKDIVREADQQESSELTQVLSDQVVSDRLSESQPNDVVIPKSKVKPKQIHLYVDPTLHKKLARFVFDYNEAAPEVTTISEVGVILLRLLDRAIQEHPGDPIAALEALKKFEP